MPKFGKHLKFGLEKFGIYILQDAVSPNTALPQLSTYTQRSKPVVYMPTGKAVSVSLLTTSDGVAKLINQGGILYEGQNVATRALKDALESNLIQYEVQLYIQDNNQRWVDMTERASINGRNMLLRLGSITYTAERLRGQLQQRLSSISMDNSDGFWDKPFPASLKATLDSDFNEIDPVAAVFTETSGGNSSVIYNHKACVRIKYLLTGELIPNILTLGVFIITDINQSGRSRTATLTLSPLSQPLIETEAKSVKRGTNWFSNASVEYLVASIIQKVYPTNEALSAGIPRIPLGWTVDTVSNIKVPIEYSEGWVVSQFGRPTDKLSTSNGKVQYNFPTTRATAVKAWEYNTGTISITPESDIVTGSNTNWTSTVSSGSMLNAIKVGDSFIVSPEYYSGDGGSSKGNDDYYTITEIISSTSIRLDRAPVGTVQESGLKYTIGRLYVGVGPKLYEYSLSSDIYTEIADLSTNTTAPIRHIEFTHMNTHPIALISIADITYNQAAWKPANISPALSTSVAASDFTYAKAEEFNHTKKNQGSLNYLTWDNSWNYSTVSNTGDLAYKRFDFVFNVFGNSGDDIVSNGNTPYPDDYGSATDAVESSRQTFPLEIGAVKRQHTDKIVSTQTTGRVTIGGKDAPIYLPHRTTVYSLCGSGFSVSGAPMNVNPTRFFKRDGGEYHVGYSTESGDGSKWDSGSQPGGYVYKSNTLGSSVLFSGTNDTSATASYRISPYLEEGVYDSVKYGQGYNITTAANQTVYDGYLQVMHAAGGRGAFERVPINHSVSGTKCEVYFYAGSKYFNKYSFATLGDHPTGGSSFRGEFEYPPYASQSQWYVMIAPEPSSSSGSWYSWDFDRITCDTSNSTSGVTHETFEDYTPVCSHVDSDGRIYVGLVRFGGEGRATSFNGTNNTSPVLGDRLDDSTYGNTKSTHRRYNWAVVAIELTMNSSAHSVTSYKIKVIEQRTVLNDALANQSNGTGNTFANAKVPYEISTTPITNSGATPSSGQLIYVSLYNLSRVGNAAENDSTAYGYSSSKHELLRYDWDEASSNLTPNVIETSSGFMQGLTPIRVNSSASGIKMSYWDAGDSIMKGVDAYLNTSGSGPHNFQNVQLTQIPETTVDTYQYCRPASFTNSREIYWISSDVPHSLFLTEGYGKYNLTKWSCMAAIRVELADFDGMSCWDALGNLAELSNCRYGFNPDGTFFFKRKPRSQLSAYTFSDNPTNGQIIQFDKASGYSEIANVISKTPYRTQINDTKASLVLSNDSPYGKIPDNTTDADKPTQHVITPISTGIDNAKIIIACVNGGRLRESNEADNQAEIAKFSYKYITQYSETETLVNYTTSDQELTLRELGEVHLGSTISVVGVSQTANNDLSNLNPEITRTARVGARASLGSNLRVKTDTNLSHIEEGQTHIVLQKSNGQDADLNVNLDAPISEKIGRGTIICIRDTSGASDRVEYMAVERIATTDTSNDTIVVNRAHYNNFPAFRLARGSEVYVIKKETKVYLNTALSSSNDDIFNSGSQVVIIVPWSGDSINLKSDPLTQTGESEYATFSMIVNAPNWIGGRQGPYATGVGITFTSTEAENKFPNHSFAVGDRIVIESAGLALEPDNGSIQTARNLRSISQFGEKQRTSVQNSKFMNVNQAYWSALRDLNEYAFPKYTFTLDTIFTPWIDFDSIISIEGQSILPSTSEFKMEAYITQMTLDPQARAMVRLTARSTSPI